jgi:hypothetical protein
MKMRANIGIFVNGSPEFETCFHIARRLKERGLVSPIIVSPNAFLRREERARLSLEQAGLTIYRRPNWYLKRRYQRIVADFDINLTLSDPLSDRTAYQDRNRYVRSRGVSQVFIQHGVVQGGLNCMFELGVHFYADRVLLYEDLGDNEQHFPQESLDKMHVVGFVKKNSYGPAPVSTEVRRFLSKFTSSILVCHSFRWAGRYTEQDVLEAYKMIAGFCAENPETLVILRSHRGKIRKVHSATDRAYRDLPNLVFAYDHHGMFRRWKMTDLLQIVDRVVSHPSTAVLDSIYLGKPIGILTERTESTWFQKLPQIETVAELAAFNEVSQFSDACFQDILRLYGDTTENIEKACLVIENLAREKGFG